MRWMWLSIVLTLPAFGASVRGLVQNAEKRAVSGAKVIIFHELSMVLVQRAVTDRKGVYRVNLSPGPYRLMVLKQDYHPLFEKLLLRSEDAKENLNHTLTSSLTVADQESMRNLKHILRNSDREPLKDLNGFAIPQLALEAGKPTRLGGEFSTGAKPDLDGSVDLVSHVQLRTSVRDHVLLAAEVMREETNHAAGSREIQSVDAAVSVELEDWQLGVSGGSVGDVQGNGHDGCQRLAAVSRFSGLAEWEGRIDVEESQRIDGAQMLVQVHQNLSHDLGRGTLDHRMKVEKWNGNSGSSSTSADYSLSLASQNHHPWGIYGYWSALDTPERRSQMSEIRAIGATTLADRSLHLKSELGLNHMGQSTDLVQHHQLVAKFGSIGMHATYDRRVALKAWDSTEVYGTHFRDPLAPHFFESFFHNRSTTSELGLNAALLGSWRGEVTVCHRRESADLIFELGPDRFAPNASLDRTRGQCVLENEDWAGRLSVGFGRESNENMAFRQADISYAQNFSSLVSGVPALSVVVRVARQPELPAWWLLSEMPWDPRQQSTFYEGQVRLVF